MELPIVSILIAARNEENNLPDLLKSLARLSYPKERTQVLFGNDASTDQTPDIIRHFIATQGKHESASYRLLNIDGNIGNLRGKANVLAQLAHHAIGEYLLFTDADVEVPTNWVEQMIALADSTGNAQKTGVVTGITLVKSANWFEACQALEWLFALKLMKIMADYRMPSTGMGNNMLVLAEAYQAVGGYEQIGFSIVEDYALYKAIIDKGYNFKQGFEPSVMTVTKPPPNYFEQRKRWVAGGLSTGSGLIIPALIQGFALPLLIITGFFVWQVPVLLMGLIMLVNLIAGYKILKKLHLLRLFKYIPVYTLYMYVFWFLQLVSYFLPTKLVWKGRSY
ncbi:glycosyltransferase [Emticicia sp. 17c]|uniref:glycosyltransferase n=1 Tax=Emticicia sp. 17c TaxID=3127704 RepID=UPI00301C8450